MQNLMHVAGVFEEPCQYTQDVLHGGQGNQNVQQIQPVDRL